MAGRGTTRVLLVAEFAGDPTPAEIRGAVDAFLGSVDTRAAFGFSLALAGKAPGTAGEAPAPASGPVCCYCSGPARDGVDLDRRPPAPPERYCRECYDKYFEGC